MDRGGQGDAGGLIRGYRREAGLTQRELAHAAGVSVGVVRDLEQSRTARLQEDSVRRLSRALRLDRNRAAEFSRAAGGQAAAGPAELPERSGKLRLGVLGPLRAWHGGAPLSLGGPRQRSVLGLLALHPEYGLQRAAIIDALWGDDPPATAAAMVQSYISRLRCLLGGGGGGELVVAVAAGYQLRVAACDLDHVTFAALAGRARGAHAAGDLLAACEAYARALALWRGEPLADVDALRGHPAVTRLSQERAAAVIGYAEAASAAGCHDRALEELRGLAGREPLNERAHAWLMIALAGSGYQAAALSIYDELRRRLDDQLGVLPGAQLADAHARVLRQDIPGATVPRDAILAAGPATPPACPAPSSGGSGGRGGADPEIPRQLPGRVAHFAGRAGELVALTAQADQAAGLEPETVVISALGGTAGVGKTALAVHWAHQVAEQFPDGQLYINLRGYDPGQPVASADALAGFLRALGVAGRDIPADPDERAARYRSLLAGKRVLVVLDNAREAEQVRPLLPGTPACVAVVTSRDSLAGLVARDGAVRLDLDLLPLPDALDLLRALIGQRAAADSGAATALARQCSRLPLALRVAAELAAARPAVSLAGLVAELADQQRRLDLLDADGDPRTAVRAVFSWSCRHLEPDAARAFRLAGLHPGPDFDCHAAAALTATSIEQAERLLGLLASAHLIQPAGPGRYGLHDLLRAYARELAAASEPDEEQRVALTRLLDHYLHTAASAMDTLFPAEQHRRPRVLPPATPTPPVTGDPAAARAWLDAQRASLVAAATHAASCGWPGHAVRLAATLWRYLETGGHYPEAITVHTHACRAARQVGDRAAEATALTSLGFVDLRQCRHRQADDYLRRALALFRETGDWSGEARAVGNLGTVELQIGRYQQASSRLRRALVLFRKVGDASGEARALINLGFVEERRGHDQLAAGHLRQALALCRKVGDASGEARALINLGLVEKRQGHDQRAAAHLRRALTLFRETGDPAGQAYALCSLGLVEEGQGQYQQAADHLDQALALFRATGDRSGEARTLNCAGQLLVATGQPADARAQHTAALSLASRIGDKYEQARAHEGLARSYRAIGDLALVRGHLAEALVLYTGLGVPEAHQVRAQLTMAGQGVCREP